MKFLARLFAPRPAPDLPVSPPRGLPWRPFHDKQLPEGAHHALFDRRDSMELRAVMELLEDTISKEADGLDAVGTRSLERAAGMFEAYLEFHRRIVRMVEKPPRES